MKNHRTYMTFYIPMGLIYIVLQNKRTEVLPKQCWVRE